MATSESLTECGVCLHARHTTAGCDEPLGGGVSCRCEFGPLAVPSPAPSPSGPLEVASLRLNITRADGKLLTEEDCERMRAAFGGAARAALEVARRALERIRALTSGRINPHRATWRCYSCGVDYTAVTTKACINPDCVLNIASRALATLRGTAAPAPAPLTTADIQELSRRTHDDYQASVAEAIEVARQLNEASEKRDRAATPAAQRRPASELALNLVDGVAALSTEQRRGLVRRIAALLEADRRGGP